MMSKKSGDLSKTIDTRRIALNAIFIAGALIMFLLERLFDPIMWFAPGAKMGLSNIFSLVGLVILGPVDAYIIVIVRCLLSMMFGTAASALMYALSGGIVALTLMFLLYKFVFPRISIIAISVAGAVAHNIAQVIVLCLWVGRWEMISYLPWLSVAGVAAGIIVGFASFFIIKHLPLNVYYKPKKPAGTDVIIDSPPDENKESDSNDQS